MHEILLILHSITRWVILAAGVMTLVRAFSGMKSAKNGNVQEWSASDRKWAMAFVHGITLQLLLGLTMYLFASPVMQEIFADFGAAMKNRVLRFWAVEHAAIMLAATAIAHIGSARVKKAADGAKHKTALIFFGIALTLILAGIPWYGLAYGRPLFRFF